MTLAAGTRLGPYEVLSPLGAGGMGEVYKARDTRLGRDVAVKVLPEALSTDAERLSRFEKEARSTSALNHPNIVTIHDVGPLAGSLYVVLELLDGETLRERLAAGAIPLRKAIDYAIQIAHGLAAAHELGIVHRDLKPENLFVTRDGRVKILDFGLAKRNPGVSESPTEARTATGTEPGVILGTVGYMSPEQVRGREAGHSSDIFAFGAILYEMLSGRRAFVGESPADIMTAILREDPPALTGVVPGLHSVGERLVRRCLEKNPDERFQMARDLGFALEALAEPQPAAAVSVPPTPTAAAAQPRQRSVAVLPFKNLAPGGENAYLGLGMADATITELALIRSLLVRPTAAILAYQERLVEPQTAGRELGVDAVVAGSIQSVGSRLRVTVQLIETAEGRSLWGTKIDASLEDLFRMQDEVSHKIVEALAVELSPSDERRLAKAGRPGGRAYELYVKGRLELLSETRLPELRTAIDYFEQARAADPESPLAMVGLADAYTRMAFSFDPEGEWYSRAEAMCERALGIDPSLPEARYVRGRLLWNPRRGFDHEGALREFFGAIAAKPSLSEAHHFAAMVLLHVGLLEESVRAFDRALAIYPGDEFASVHRGLSRYLQGKFAEGLEVTERFALRRPSTWVFYQLAQCQLRLGMTEAAAQTVDRFSREFPGDFLLTALRGLVAAVAGDAPRARALIDATIRDRNLFGHFHHAQYDFGCIHALVGETDRAIEWLDEAARNGFPCLPFFEHDPFLESVRAAPRFGELAARLRLKIDGYRRLYGELSARSGETPGRSGSVVDGRGN